MPTKHTVGEGECISSIAEKYGFFPKIVWDDPANASLKKERGDMNLLVPGDVVNVPDKKTKEVDCGLDKTHKFRKKGVPAIFRMQVFDGESPRANQHYTLAVGDQQFFGSTDGEGVLEANVSPTATDGYLVIGPDQYEVEIKIGYLRPVSETVGVQQRLNNLGYDCGPEDGKETDLLAEAVSDFQARFSLPVTGKIDTTTCAKLEEIHDDPNEYPDA